jgi:hypothetical protein
MWSIMSKSMRVVGTPFRGWVYGVVLSVLVMEVVALAYVLGDIRAATLVFAGICVFALGGVALFFRTRMTHPPEIVEQLLYRTEHSSDRNSSRVE